MSAHVHWGSSRAEWPVLIEPCGGVSGLLDVDLIRTYLQRQEHKAIGIMVDANENAGGRWQRIRDECAGDFRDLPRAFPPEGLISANPSGRRLGVWIMPDNHSEGMLEDFLTPLVPEAHGSLWRYAQEATNQARTCGATYRDAHVAKARTHAYLAWQDRPGRSFGDALKAGHLDPHSEHALPFVTWFKRLYELGS